MKDSKTSSRSRKKSKPKPAPKRTSKLGKVALTGTVAKRRRKGELRHILWSSIPVEPLNSLLGRQLIVGQDLMLARVLLKKGCVVPEHSHPNEQITLKS